MGLCHPAAPAVSDGAQQEDNGHGSDTDAAVTLSDTLSAATPFASPRGEVQAELSGFSGAMAPGAPDEATPGFTPPPSPHSLTAAPSRCPGRMLARRAQCPASEARCCELPPAPLSWQDARPPHEAPSEPCSWLFVPLPHAAAGTLTPAATHVWQCHPHIGPRFAELAGALRQAPAAQPSTILRFLHAELACIHRDPAHGAAAAWPRLCCRRRCKRRSDCTSAPRTAARMKGGASCKVGILACPYKERLRPTGVEAQAAKRSVLNSGVETFLAHAPHATCPHSATRLARSCRIAGPGRGVGRGVPARRLAPAAAIRTPRQPSSA